jgi:molybdenum cofactor biosynthesis protein B
VTTQDETTSIPSGGAVLQSALITVSEDRTLETDDCGLGVLHRLEAAGIRVAERTVVPEDPGRLAHVLRHWLSTAVDAIVVAGGDGKGGKDDPVDVTRRFLDVEIPGFATLLSLLCHEEAGSKALWIRGIAGFAHGKIVFALPRIAWVVELALEKLIVPELRALAAERRSREGNS